MSAYQYRLLRYHPNPSRAEHVNIGIIVVPPQGRYGVTFTRDLKRVQCLHADADAELIHNTIEELQRELTDPAQAEEALSQLDRNLSNQLQISDAHGLDATSADEALAQLKETFLDAPSSTRQRNPGARAQLYEIGIRQPFSAAGLWPMMQKNIAVTNYVPGDLLRLDCGYGFDGTRKFFHAVPIASDPDAAKLLAFSYKGFVEGVRRIEKAEAELTAVVEDNLDRKNASYLYALEALERTQIQIAPVSRMPELAELARKELRL